MGSIGPITVRFDCRAAFGPGSPFCIICMATSAGAGTNGRVGQHQAQVLVLVQVWGEVEYLNHVEVEYLNHVHQKHHTSVHQAFVSFYPLHIDFK